MNITKPFITDPYEFSLRQQRAVETRLEERPENRERWPTNDDLRAVLKRFKGSVWLRFPTLEGLYTFQLGKASLFEELSVTANLRCDFSIYSVNPAEPSIVLIAFNPAKFNPLRT